MVVVDEADEADVADTRGVGAGAGEGEEGVVGGAAVRSHLGDVHGLRLQIKALL